MLFSSLPINSVDSLRYCVNLSGVSFFLCFRRRSPPSTLHATKLGRKKRFCCVIYYALSYIWRPLTPSGLQRAKMSKASHDYGVDHAKQYGRGSFKLRNFKGLYHPRAALRCSYCCTLFLLTLLAPHSLRTWARNTWSYAKLILRS